jgi:Flp pilus assembly protein TadD
MWGKPSLVLGLCLLIGSVLLGCRSRLDLIGLAPVIPPSDERPSDEPLYLAKVQFQNGNYGLAEAYYRRAVEANSKSIDAWLGLAACYDRLSRFDLADRAYKELIKLVGYTPTVLNNLGYHFLLEGNLVAARKYLTAAYAKEPDNPQIISNLHLMETWATAPGGAVR